MDRENLRLIFIAISAITGVLLVSSQTDYLNRVPSIFRGWVGAVVIALIVFYPIWQVLKQGDEEAQRWYSDVEQTANGIQQAWYDSGFRLKEEDCKRTVEEMDKYTDQLKNHRTHQNATEDLVEKMNRIIELWDRSRSLILTPNRSKLYHKRRECISDNAEKLKESLNKERQGRVRTAVSKIPAKVGGGIERVRKWRYQRQSNPLPYELYREISSHLSDACIFKFTEGNDFLRINREDSTSTEDIVFYEEDKDKYNIFQINRNGDGEIVDINKLSGKSVTEDNLLQKLRQAETVGTIRYKELIQNDQSLEEFEKR